MSGTIISPKHLYGLSLTVYLILGRCMYSVSCVPYRSITKPENAHCGYIIVVAPYLVVVPWMHLHCLPGQYGSMSITK